MSIFRSVNGNTNPSYVEYFSGQPLSSSDFDKIVKLNLAVDDTFILPTIVGNDLRQIIFKSVGSSVPEFITDDPGVTIDGLTGFTLPNANGAVRLVADEANNEYHILSTYTGSLTEESSSSSNSSSSDSTSSSSSTFALFTSSSTSISSASSSSDSSSSSSDLSTSSTSISSSSSTSVSSSSSSSSSGSSSTSVSSSSSGSAPFAARFIGTSSQYLSIADNASLSMGDIDFTIVTWVYVDAVGALTESIVTKYNSGSNQRSYALTKAANDSFAFVVSGDGISDFSVSTPISSVQANTWYMVTAWHDSVNNEIGIAINDNQPATPTATTAGAFDNTAEFQIGSVEGGGPDYMDGRIGPTGIWKNRVLSDSDRNTLFNGGDAVLHSSLPAGLLTNLESYWNLDELNGSRLDSEGSNDLTDNNNVTRASGPVAAEDTSFSSSTSSSSSSSIEFSSFSSSSSSSTSLSSSST